MKVAAGGQHGRRQFLKGGAATVAALGVATSLPGSVAAALRERGHVSVGFVDASTGRLQAARRVQGAAADFGGDGAFVRVDGLYRADQVCELDAVTLELGFAPRGAAQVVAWRYERLPISSSAPGNEMRVPVRDVGGLDIAMSLRPRDGKGLVALVDPDGDDDVTTVRLRLDGKQGLRPGTYVLALGKEGSEPAWKRLAFQPEAEAIEGAGPLRGPRGAVDFPYVLVTVRPA